MRTIDSSAQAELEGRDVALAVLVFMDLTEPMRLCSAGRDIEFDGDTYQALGDLGSVEPIKDSIGEIKGLRFMLSGVSNDNLVIALDELIKNKAVAVRLAVLHPDTHAVLDAVLLWSGTLDQMPIEFGKTTSVINVTSQHRGVTYSRVKALRYTNADQQRLFPGDTSLRFVAEQAGHQDIWPARGFFAQ